jgi:nucleotide-binding universal stress UspA family protein
MFSKIVVGTDGSDTAAVAVEKAAALAERTGAELVVVHAYRTIPPVGDVGMGAVVPDPAVMDEVGRELLQRVEEHLSGRVRARTILRRGDPAHSIVDTAKQERADLIVVGSRGMRGARRVLGSVPNSVAHAADCDVLIVHTRDVHKG